jgi:hypothetical protein
MWTCSCEAAAQGLRQMALSMWRPAECNAAASEIEAWCQAGAAAGGPISTTEVGAGVCIVPSMKRLPHTNCDAPKRFKATVCKWHIWSVCKLFNVRTLAWVAPLRCGRASHARVPATLAASHRGAHRGAH